MTIDMEQKTPSPSPNTPNTLSNLRRVLWLACAAFLSLVCASGYMLCARSPTLIPSPVQRGLRHRLSRLAFRPVSSSHQAAPKTFQLLPHQEFAAITSFITSSPTNVLPITVQPSVPIDPHLVLGFDISHSSDLVQELQQLEDELWSRFPVVLFSKHYCHHSRLLKRFLEELNLHPLPTFIDVDTRDDFFVIGPILQRLTGSVGVPVLIIGGKVVRVPGDYPAGDRSGLLHYLETLKASGKLPEMFSEAGAVINGAQRKKKLRAGVKHAEKTKELSFDEKVHKGIINI